MNRRSFLTGLLGLPLLMLPKATEAKVLEPVDVAIRDKRIVLGDGGYVRDSTLENTGIELKGNYCIVSHCHIQWKKP